MALSVRRAAEILAAAPRQRIVVVGDLMLDRYAEGTVDRLSPEAPVPIVRVRSERGVPGGASNVAMNLRAMGARASVCGAVGVDPAGRELLAMLKAARVETSGVVRWRGAPTTVKTRVIAERQQVCRIDREEPLAWNARSLAEAAALIQAEISRATAVILEDYGKGFLCQEIADAALAVAARRRLPSGLDPKENHELQVKGVTVATPNRREAFHAARLDDPGPAANPEQDEPLRRVAATLLRRWAPRQLLITLGPHGMLLARRGVPPRHIPTRALEVYDVSGAGDTVIAVHVLALAAGASDVEAAEMANYAAGVVVAKLGAATCTPQELMDHMRECGAPEG